MAFDIYAEITDRIIAEMESGIIPWEKPWTGVRVDGAIRHVGGKPYSLLNQMLLGKPGEYLTFNQCKAEGGNVKKGAKSKMVVFWKFLEKPSLDENGKPEVDSNGLPIKLSIPYLRYYNVFHIDDCEGIKAKWTSDEIDTPNSIQPIDKAQKVLDEYIDRENVGLVNRKCDMAYYSPSQDAIVLPLFEQFTSAELYYDTAFHESVHSTGHRTRLNRLTTGEDAAFGKEAYSKEELVAEIGACSIMHELDLETDKTFRNNAAYIQNWLSALKNDKRLIVSAASRAEKAVALILNRSSDQNTMME